MAMTSFQTKFIMTASSAILGTAGIMSIFIPGEIAEYMHLQNTESATLVMQVAGALYFAFALLNWMTRTSLIGGIYNRPVAMANFAHFLIAGLTMTKRLIAFPGLSFTYWLLTACYIFFLISFTLIILKSPNKIHAK